jgi:hypothetical protein
MSYNGNMSKRTLEFRSILLSGYKKRARAYSPKTLANIRGLEGVIEDQCKTNSFPAC